METHQVQAVGVYRVRRDGIDTPVIPTGVVDEVQEWSPGVVGVELIRASNVRAGKGKALLGWIEDDIGNEATATADLDVLPGVSLGRHRSDEGDRRRDGHSRQKNGSKHG